MTASEIVKIIVNTLRTAETEARDREIEASPGGQDAVLRVIDRWQGDNGVVFGTFADALKNLTEYREAPIGCGRFDPDEDSETDFLADALTTSGTIGTGEPLAYVGADGYFTLIRAGATRAEIECATVACLPVGGADEH